MSSSSTPSEEDEKEFFDVSIVSNGLVLCDIFLPEEILLNILIFVSWNDLKSCRLVCQSWKRSIDSVVAFEKLRNFSFKALDESFLAPPSKIKPDSVPFYLYFAISKGGFGKNLMKNTFGSGNDPHVCQRTILPIYEFIRVHMRGRDNQNPYINNSICSQVDCPKFKHWGVLESGGDGWHVEAEPEGCEPLPAHLPERSCFVTSYQVCKKEQVIKLSEHGLNAVIMDQVQPQFDVSEWYARRFDCGIRYKLKVILLNENKEPLHEYKVEAGEGLLDSEWHQASLSVKDYGPGVRYLTFLHAGIDTQFWAGPYGAKMAGGCVIARIPTSKYQRTNNVRSLDDL